MKVSTQHHSACVQIHSLPYDTTAAELADWFFPNIGLALQTENIELKRLENGLYSQAIVAVGRVELADFLDRAVEQAGLFKDRKLCVRPKH
jgi:hypothetical protein